MQHVCRVLSAAECIEKTGFELRGCEVDTSLKAEMEKFTKRG